MPRHISSVVPSPQTTYFSWVPSNAGSRSRSSWLWWQVTRRVSPASRCSGSIRRAPWSSKFQSGMSRTCVRVRRAGVGLDLDPLAEQVHVAGRAEDRHRARDGPGAGGGVGRIDVRPAQEVQQVGQLTRAVAEPGLGVLDGGLAVAQRAERVLGPAWHLDGRREQRGVNGPDVGSGLGRPADLGGGLVSAVAEQQVVVHLHDDLGAPVERGAVSLAGHRLATAGRPRAEPGGVVHVVELTLEAHAAEAGPALLRGGGVLGLGLGDLLVGDTEQDHVVHDLRVARQDLGAGQPGVLGQLRVEQEAPVVVGALAGGSRRLVRRGDLQRRPLLAGAELAGLHRLGRDRRGVVVRDDDLLAAGRGDRLGPRRVVRVQGDVAAEDAGDSDEQDEGQPQLPRLVQTADHPGGHPVTRPASTCRWAWNTVCPASGPVLKTIR